MNAASSIFIDLPRVLSGKWQGADWSHRLTRCSGFSPNSSELAILEVTGDDAGLADQLDAEVLCRATDRMVYTLFDVPNQPCWGMREDDLLAHSFSKFIETGDRNWPLLNPMVTAVVRAMDTIAERDGITKFVVTGASKRGWTCWLAAATGDPRIVGIAPRVFDNLAMEQQMAKQIEDWGAFSPRVGDYTGRGLQDMMASDRGQELLRMVDPIHRVVDIQCPQLVVNATNDDFWTTDASMVYNDQLPNARYFCAFNQGHGIERGSGWERSLAAFADACETDELLPGLECEVVNGTLAVNGEAELYRLWATVCDSKQFSNCHWRCFEENRIGKFAIRKIEGAKVAYSVEGLRNGYSLCTPVRVTG